MPVNVVDGYIFKILARIGLAAQVPTLQTGELGYDTDTKTGRLGDNTAQPPRLMTDKSTGIFNFQFLTYARFPRVEMVPGGKVDGVDVSTMNGDNGLVARIADGTMANRKVISGNSTVSVVNGDGVAGDIDIRVTDELVAQLTPPKFWVSDVEPQSPRVGDYWHDTDGIDAIDGNADDGIVYIRNTDGVTEYWTQISNEYQNASETIVGLTRYATVQEALDRVLNTVALTPRSITALIGAGNDFRTVLNATTTAPPSSPASLDAYLVPIGASGAWSTQVGKIATWDGAIWIYDQLRLGAFVVDSNKSLSSGLRFLQQTSTLTWQTLSATESGPGIIEIATQAETNAGVDDVRAVTPLKLKNYFPTLTANNPVFPEVLTNAGLFNLTVSPGQFIVPTSQAFLWRGLNLYKTEDFSLAQRTFTTLANKTYHFRWYAPGHPRAVTLGIGATGGFALEDLANAGYNAGSLAQLHTNFDSTYDSILFNTITTNGSNILTVSQWYNKANLSYQGSQGLISNQGYYGQFSVGVSLGVTAWLDFYYNWARTPEVRAYEMTVGWSAGNFYNGTPYVDAYANQPGGVSVVNRQVIRFTATTDYREGLGPIDFVNDAWVAVATCSLYA